MSLRIALLLLATTGTLPGTALAQTTAEASPRTAIDTATKLARWQLARMNDVSHISRAGGETRNPRAWEQAAFWVGMTALADHGAPADIGKAILDMGTANQWLPAKRPYHADDLAITQSYLWAAKHGGGAAALAPTRKAFDFIVDNPPRVTLAFTVPDKGGYNGTECLKRWCWCDALFMAPPVWLKMAQATGEQRYADYVHEQWKKTYDLLYDKEEHLFARDTAYEDPNKREPNGKKIFWSRGEGWVMAGLAKVLDLTPKNDPNRQFYVQQLQEMSAKLASIQDENGEWHAGLLDPQAWPLAETSGSALFVFGMAAIGLFARATLFADHSLRPRSSQAEGVASTMRFGMASIRPIAKKVVQPTCIEGMAAKRFAVTSPVSEK